MEVTFSCKVGDSQCVQEGQMFHSLGRVCIVEKGLDLKLGIPGGPGERLFMPILYQ